MQCCELAGCFRRRISSAPAALVRSGIPQHTAPPFGPRGLLHVTPTMKTNLDSSPTKAYLDSNGQTRALQQQQQQQQQQQLLDGQHDGQQHRQGQEIAGRTSTESWTKRQWMQYVKDGRNWAAVEDFYMQLVTGQQCLSVIGLSPAGQPAAGMGSSQQRPAAQHDQNLTTPQQEATRTGGSAHSRSTYKLHVSYLGGQFSGWQRGSPSLRPAVQDSLAAAIAATGLCERGVLSKKKVRRAAGRAARLEFALKQAAGGVAMEPVQETDAAAATSATAVSAQHQQAAGQVSEPTVKGAGSAYRSAAVADTQLQPASSQLPFVQCGGRTDAGVSATGQVASFYSWQPPVPPDQLVARINQHLQVQWAAAAAEAAAACNIGSCCSSSGSSPNNSTDRQQCSSSSAAELGDRAAGAAPVGQQAGGPPPVCPVRVWQAELVPRQFHPAFAATWRRYVYLLPLATRHHTGAGGPVPAGYLPRFTPQLQSPCDLTPEQQAAVQAAPDVDPQVVNTLLQPLQRRQLDYYAFARDTPKDKDCDCTLLVARASTVYLPVDGERALQQQQQHWLQEARQPMVQSSSILDGMAAAAPTTAGCPCLAVELVGDRFLRKMVRVLVGTAIREAVILQQMHADPCAGHDGYGHLLQLLMTQDRAATAGPAPALGLCFAAVGYSDDDQD